MQMVMGRKVLSEQAQKFSANVDFYILAKWWVKPHDVLFFGFSRFTVVVAFMHQFFIYTNLTSIRTVFLP